MKRVLLQVHLWIGLILCVPFVLLGVTGSVLVYDQEIISGGAPSPRASATGAMQAPSAIVAAASAVRSELAPSALIMPVLSGDPAVVRLARPGERRGAGRLGTQVFVDPVSLQILEVRDDQRSELVRLAHDLHGNLLLGMPDGRSIVGWLGIGMTLLGLSGIVMWWPKKKGQWRRAIGVTRRARGFLLHRQLHTTAGVSAWIVFVVVSISGVGISFPNTVGGFLGARPVTPLPRVDAAEGAERIGIDDAVATALAAAPDTRLANVNMPMGGTDSYRINLAVLGGLAGAPPVLVTVDPYRARVITMRDARKGSAGDAMMMWQRPLHTGDAFGWLGRLLVFVTGLLPAFFAVTGISMWLARRRTPPRREGVLEGAAAE